MKRNYLDFPPSLKKISASLRKCFARRQNAVDRDMAGIETSSKLLGLSEFSFFQLAHSTWYGRELPVRAMERIFAEYLFESKVPFWVRHLSRTVLSRQVQRAGTRGEFRETGFDHPAATPGTTIVCLVFYMIISGLIVFL